MARRIGFWLVTLLAAAGVAFAQESGGQLWVNVFEDRNGNGQRDGGEPLVTRGVSVNLMNQEGVVIASALLDDSPNAARGLIGFQRLPPGTYTVVVTSPDLTPTTSDTFTETIEAGGLPTVLNFGGPRATAETTPAEVGGVDPERDQIARIAIAGLGALIVMGAMTVLGLIVYMILLRRRFAGEARMTSTGISRVITVDDEDDLPPLDEKQRDEP